VVEDDRLFAAPRENCSPFAGSVVLPDRPADIDEFVLMKFHLNRGGTFTTAAVLDIPPIFSRRPDGSLINSVFSTFEPSVAGLNGWLPHRGSDEIQQGC
jgi:hypothetical protein